MIATSSFQQSKLSTLPRVRPGIAVSIILHALLLLGLAYALSFAPRTLTTDDPDKALVLMPPPPPVTRPKPVVQHEIFQPQPMEPLRDVPLVVAPLPIPPVVDLHQPRETRDTASEPAVIQNPRPISRGGLVYPDRAAEAGKSGYVDFTFTIEPDGSVGDAQVIAEVPEGYGFAAAARRALPTWRFAPKLVNGAPVAVPAQIRVSFQLR